MQEASIYSFSLVRTGTISRVAALLALLLLMLFVFGPSGQDDSHITYSAAKMLAEQGAVLNINHEWVEQGSSLLHVALLAGLYKLMDIPMDVLGILFSMFCAMLCLPLTVLLAREMGIRRYSLAGWLLVFSTAFTYWGMGGLETTFVALLMLYNVFAVNRFLQAPSVGSMANVTLAVCLYLISRPEAFFVTVAALMALSAFLLRCRQGEHLQKTALLAVVAIAAFSIISAVRYHYYGQILPQPVYAKASGLSIEKIGFGLLYFVFSSQLSIVLYSLLLLIPLYKMVKKYEMPLLLIVAVSFSCAHIAFVITSGGDWMMGGRFFAPVMPLLVCIALVLLQNSKRFNYYAGFLLVVCILEVAFFSRTQSTGIPFYKAESFRESLKEQPEWQGFNWPETMNYVHVRDIALLDNMYPLVDFLKNEKATLNVMTVQMGMVPYYLQDRYKGKVYFIDLRGLTTRHIAGCQELSGVEKIWTGVFVRYTDYFAALEKGTCDLPRPDIVVDLLSRDKVYNRARMKTLKENNYRITYLQSGLIKAVSSNKQLRSGMFIAVDGDLYKTLPESLRDQRFVFKTKRSL